jgi:hypothetical protein
VVNEAPAGFKDVRSRLVLDTNASDERREPLITWKRRNSLPVEKYAQSATSEQRGRKPLKTRRGPWQFATALAVEGLVLYGQGPDPVEKSKKPETVPLNCDDAVMVPVVLTTTTKSD